MLSLLNKYSYFDNVLLKFNSLNKELGTRNEGLRIRNQRSPQAGTMKPANAQNNMEVPHKALFLHKFYFNTHSFQIESWHLDGFHYRFLYLQRERNHP